MADGVVEPQTAAEMRQQLIDEELNSVLKEVVERKLEREEMEPESVEALQTAANKICYLKKFYNISRDKIIYFPTVTKSLINYRLLEEAEKHYFDEEDEFPMDYSIALREVAFSKTKIDSEGNDDDYEDIFDDEMMERLSMNLILTEEEQEEFRKAMEQIQQDEDKEGDDEAMKAVGRPVKSQVMESGDKYSTVIGLVKSEDQSEDKDVIRDEGTVVGEIESLASASSVSDQTSENASLLLLISSESKNLQWVANQDTIVTMLEAQGMTPTLLDDADPSNKERRDELFEISGDNDANQYPQLFIIYGDDIQFVGNFDMVKDMNDCGKLTQHELLGIEPSKLEPKPSKSKAPPIAEILVENSQEGPTFHLQSSIETESKKIVTFTQSFTSETAPVYDSESEQSKDDLCCWFFVPCWFRRKCKNKLL
jgi:hypothetical protein